MPFRYWNILRRLYRSVIIIIYQTFEKRRCLLSRLDAVRHSYLHPQSGITKRHRFRVSTVLLAYFFLPRSSRSCRRDRKIQALRGLHFVQRRACDARKWSRRESFWLGEEGENLSLLCRTLLAERIFSFVYRALVLLLWIVAIDFFFCGFGVQLRGESRGKLGKLIDELEYDCEWYGERSI